MYACKVFMKIHKFSASDSLFISILQKERKKNRLETVTSLPPSRLLEEVQNSLNFPANITARFNQTFNIDVNVKIYT